MNSYDGLLISVEGIDKSGKGELIARLQDEFSSDEWEFTAEPSNGKYGRLVREELQSDDDPTLSDFFLFCADRADHINSLIGPKLEDGTNVITDRYNASTYAYQAPIVKENIISRLGFVYIDEVVTEFVIEPDLTIYIDVPVDVALSRMGENPEKYENRERLERAREIYKDFVDHKRNVYEIDGTQHPSDVFDSAMEQINEIRD